MLTRARLAIVPTGKREEDSVHEGAGEGPGDGAVMVASASPAITVSARNPETLPNPLEGLPEDVQRRMIRAHCMALVDWINRLVDEGRKREEGADPDSEGSGSRHDKHS